MSTSVTNEIAVIGLSCFYPGASNPRELWENILSRRQQFRQMPDVRLPSNDYYHPDPLTPDKTYQNKAAVLDGYEFDWQDRRIPKKTYESTDIVHWLALDTALNAIADAGYEREALPYRDKTGVIIGNTLTGEFTRSQQLRLRYPYVRKALRASLDAKQLGDRFEEIDATLEKYYKSVFSPITEDSLAGGLANTIAGRICNYLDLHGGGYIVDGACSSSILAICTAANHLESGQMDVAIAGGVDISLDTFELIGFSKTGALTPDEMRVYDKRGNGFLPGEGCGIVVLKRLEDARRDGDAVYAVLTGWGIASDGKGGITAPSSSKQAMALHRAYSKANFDTTQLNFVEGHGTGTTVGDKTELTGIAKALNQEQTVPARSCGVTSFKSIVGHTKAAAGVGAFIKTTIALNRRVLPPTAGLKEKHPIFQESATCLYPILHGQIYSSNEILHAGVSAMGFGGINSHVLLKSGDEPFTKLSPRLSERKLMVSNQSSEVFFFAAKTEAELTSLIISVMEEANGISYAELTDFAQHSNASVNWKHSYRAALIATSPNELYRKLELLRVTLQETNDQNSFHSSENDSIVIGKKRTDRKLRLGALYPGQGSQRLNMAYKLVERYDWAKELLEQAISIFESEGITGIREAMFPPLDRLENKTQDKEWKARLTETQIAQPAIALSSLLWHKYLTRLGLEPCIAVGHSLGELMAFHAAGYYDEATLLRFSAFRGKAMASCASGTMASLNCDRDRASSYVEKSPGYAIIANINAPNQVVISGEKSNIQAIVEMANQDGIQAVELPVAAAFHSRLVESAAESIEKCEFLTTQAQKSSEVSLISSVSGHEVSASLDLRVYFSKQAMGQVDFVEALTTVSQNCDLLMEVGTGRVLSGLAAQTAPTLKCFPVESSAEADYSFNLLLANAFVRGAALSIDELYQGRLVRPFSPAHAKSFLVNPLERPFPDAQTIATSVAKSSNRFAALMPEIPQKKLKLYLEKRSNFIRDMLLTDLKYFDPNAIASAAHSAEDIEANVRQKVLEVAAEQTGFAVESIKLEYRLLDDLNLDSIKAASLMGDLAKEYNLQGKFEPAEFANARLSTIIEAITNYLKGNESSTPQSAPTSDVSKPSWVRSFTGELVHAELTNDTLPKTPRNVAIAYNPSDITLATALSQQWGAAQVWDGSTTLGNEVDRLCVLMPQVMEGREVLEQTVDILARIAQCSVDKTFELGFVQWGDGWLGRNPTSAPTSWLSTMAFAASLHLEQPTHKIRVLEVSSNFPIEQLGQRLDREFATSDSYSVAGYDSDNVRRSIVYDLAEHCAEPRALNWNSEDVILVTGGAKGITAECAMALAQTHGCKMALVGRSSSSPDIEATLQRYRDNKQIANYFSCDISDRAAVTSLISEVVSQMGRITAVIHGAGLNTPRRAEQVTSEQAHQEIAPKLLGGLNLIEALGNYPNLKAFVAFTSIIGVTGMVGNSWYGFANESLDLLLRHHFHRSNSETEILSLAYSVWSEVGMGARMGSEKVLRNMGIASIVPELGVREFLHWMVHRSNDSQVVVAAKLGGLDTWKRKPYSTPSANRYLETIAYCELGVELLANTKLSRQHDRYVEDHNFNGSLLMPSVFGLEAMAQAALYVTGTEALNAITFENISLLRPIVVPQEGETQIQIHALVIGHKVLTSISTAESDFQTPHFAAEIILNPEKPSNHQPSSFSKEDIEKPALPLHPPTDLYSWLLFQGTMFQNIAQIHKLDENRTVLSTTAFQTDTSEICFSSEKQASFALGSPLLRDVLLQSGQLTLTQKQWLPIRIERWDIHNIGVNSGVIDCRVLKIEGDSAFYEVEFCNEESELSEKIFGYEVKALKSTSTYLKPDEISDSTRITKKINKVFKPFIDLLQDDINLIIYQHSQPFDILDSTTRHSFVQNKLPNFQFNWTAEGKPEITNSDLNISISHSRTIFLVSIGKSPEGCDLEFIEARSFDQWLNLLGHQYQALLESFKFYDKTLCEFATRIWCVKESVFKAIGQFPQSLTVERSLNKGVIFSALLTEGKTYVLTFPVEVWPKNTAIVSTVIKLKKSPPLTNLTITRPSEEALAFEALTNKYVHHFYTTFKDCKSFFGKSPFTNIPLWMGEVRELAISPISEDLLSDFRNAKYGMVTNYSELQIFNEAETLDNIVAKIWITDDSNYEESIIGMGLEWFKKDTNGTLTKLANSKIVVTWVEIVGHGLVKQVPLPAYFLKFLERFTPLGQAAYVPTNSPYLSASDLGNTEYESPASPRPSILITTKNYQTSIHDGNSVGNLYYSNYYDWQSKTIENFVFQHVPEMFSARGTLGEYVCLKSSVNHLQEAMPFEEIEITMYLEKLHTNGMKFYFEYFSLGTDGTTRRKLAYGSNTLIWAKRQDENSLPIATSIPTQIQNYFETLQA